MSEAEAEFALSWKKSHNGFKGISAFLHLFYEESRSPLDEKISRTKFI